MIDDRQLWPVIWMNLAKSISQRSCDCKTKVGAVIVSSDNTRVLSVGYNGTPHGFPNERDSLEEGKSGLIHAEQNCYYKLSYNENCEKVLYTLYSPCPECARGAIQCKINRVVYENIFRDASGLDILHRGGIKVFNIYEAIEAIKNNTW